MAHLKTWKKDIPNDAFQAALNVLMDKLTHPPKLEIPSGPFPVAPKDTFTVYTDVEKVTEHLQIPNFKLATNTDEADILWLSTEFKEFALLR
jgi:hypothetical protein